MISTDDPKIRHREIQNKIDKERKRQFQEKQSNFLVIGDDPQQNYYSNSEILN